MTTRHVAVIDIGKTNAKLALVDLETLSEIAVVTRPNEILPGPPWPHFDTEGKITKNQDWSAEGEIRTDYFYKNGLLQQRTVTGLNLDNYTVNYEYDKNGQLIRQTISGAEARIYTFARNIL